MSFETYYGSFRGRGRSTCGRIQRGRGIASGGMKRDTVSKSEVRQTNPVNFYGDISRCRICGSKFHRAKDCPESYEARAKREGDQS